MTGLHIKTYNVGWYLADKRLPEKNAALQPLVVQGAVYLAAVQNAAGATLDVPEGIKAALRLTRSPLLVGETQEKPSLDCKDKNTF
jgi:hypothetical protein